jgi:hypothetical protein
MIVTLETSLTSIFTKLEIDCDNKHKIQEMFDDGELTYLFLQARTREGDPVPVYFKDKKIGKVLDVSYDVTSERIYSIEHDVSKMTIQYGIATFPDGTSIDLKSLRKSS